MIFPKNKKISREIIILAVPVIIGNTSRVLMSLVDMAMVGRLGAEGLAATGMGSMLVWTLITFSIGLRTGTQTVASRRLGQKKLSQCGTAMHNGLLMAIIYGVPATIFGYTLADTIVPFFLGGKAGKLCIEYTTITSVGILFTSVGFIFQGFYTGIEKTKLHMKVTVTSNLINVYLNAGLIFGSEKLKSTLSDVFGMDLGLLAQLWGWTSFPEMGIKGAALATVIASAWTVIHYFFYLFKREIVNKYNVFSFSLNISMIKRQLQLALPLGIQEIIITGGWAVFYKIIGIIGVVELAATQIVFQIMHASFMPAMGLGQACATLVSKYMGEKQIDKAETSIVEGVRWSELIMGSVGLVFIIFPLAIVPLFTNDPNIVRLSIVGLRIVGVLQFFDAVGITLWFALTGAGNTLFPAIVESTLLWGLALPVSYFLGVKMQVGHLAAWAALSIHIVLFAVAITWKVSRGSWKEIEV